MTQLRRPAVPAKECSHPSLRMLAKRIQNLEERLAGLQRAAIDAMSMVAADKPWDAQALLELGLKRYGGRQ